MKHSAILLALGLGLLWNTEAVAGWPFGSSPRPSRSHNAGHRSAPSRFNLRQMHSAGRQTFRQNWGRIKGSADAAGFALGSAGASYGYKLGYVAGGPITGAAGGVIGHESPAAVTGVSRSGYYYGRGFGREAWRQFRSRHPLRR